MESGCNANTHGNLRKTSNNTSVDYIRTYSSIVGNDRDTPETSDRPCRDVVSPKKWKLSPDLWYNCRLDSSGSPADPSNYKAWTIVSPGSSYTLAGRSKPSPNWTKAPANE